MKDFTFKIGDVVYFNIYRGIVISVRDLRNIVSRTMYQIAWDDGSVSWQVRGDLRG